MMLLPGKRRLGRVVVVMGLLPMACGDAEEQGPAHAETWSPGSGVGEFKPTFELLAYEPEHVDPGVTLLSVMGGAATFEDPAYADFGYLAALPLAANSAPADELVPLWVYSDFTGGAFSEVGLLPRGNVLAIRGASGGNALHEIDPVAAETVWTYADVTVNHSFQQLPDGSRIFIYSSYLEHDTYGSDVDGDGVLEVRMDSVRVVGEDDGTLWDWALLDHDVDLAAPPSETYATLTEYWSNCNSVSFIADAGWVAGEPLAGHVYLNCRLMNRLYKIDYPSGAIQWVMGSGGDFGDGFFHHAHDPQVSHVEDASGERVSTRILLYDNREGPPLGQAETCPPDEDCPSEIEPYSRVIEIEVDNDLNAEIIWKWPSPSLPDFDAVRVYSPLAGGVQRLPNGNVLVTHATEGGNPFLGVECNGRLVEVQPDGSLTGGRVVWTVRLGSAYSTYKAVRVPADAIDGWTSSVQEPAR